MTGNDVWKVKLHRTAAVLSLATISSSVKSHEEIIPITIMQLFNLSMCLVKSDEDFASSVGSLSCVSVR